jgi:hypothetical protein
MAWFSRAEADTTVFRLPGSAVDRDSQRIHTIASILIQIGGEFHER